MGNAVVTTEARHLLERDWLCK